MHVQKSKHDPDFGTVQFGSVAVVTVVDLMFDLAELVVVVFSKVSVVVVDIDVVTVVLVVGTSPSLHATQSPPPSGYAQPPVGSSLTHNPDAVS